MAHSVARRTGTFPASPTPPREQRASDFQMKRRRPFSDAQALPACPDPGAAGWISPWLSSNLQIHGSMINVHCIRGVSMADLALHQSIDGADGGPIQPASRPNLDKGFNPLTM